MGWPLRTASMFAIASSAIIQMAWTVAVPMCGVMMTLFRFNKGWSLEETERTQCITQGTYSAAIPCWLWRTEPQEIAMAHRDQSTKLWDTCLHISSSPSVSLVAWPMSQAGKELTDMGKGITCCLFMIVQDRLRFCPHTISLPMEIKIMSTLWTQFKTFQISRMGNKFLYLGRGSGYVTSRAAALITLFWRASTNASWSITAPALKWNPDILMNLWTCFYLGGGEGLQRQMKKLEDLHLVRK